MQLRQVEYISNPKFKLTTSHVWWSTQLLALAILFISAYSGGINLIFVLLLIICILTPIFTMSIGKNEFYPINFEYLEKITLTDNEIKIGEKNLEFKSIKNLEFNVRDFKGKRIQIIGSLKYSGPTLSQGVNNVIKFENQNEKYEIRFQLSSKDELSMLGEYISKLYSKEIEFEEKYDTLKSYGLKKLTHEEIKEFKKKYCS